ncbi:MAG: type II toxin-antitoxin system VapC family toxin [Chloroflexi bacterium]|nr:type II toxin-antitoxin system VapC family toxin [Chloroflexota bacterium]MBI3734528.1 type II toxin-antitoxin system VapC family toxin [Chloroflexota bacterium]
MQIVVDSSVVVKWLVVEPYTPEARRILHDYQRGVLDLRAPDLIYAEVGNVVWKKHLFQGMTAADAQLIIDTFRLLTIRLTPTASLLDMAYRLAVTHRRTVYDMLYVALSLQAQCHFVSADEKLVSHRCA